MREKLADSIQAWQIVQDYLRVLQGSFYSDLKPFYQQRPKLIKSITLLARWLDTRGLWITEDSYRDRMDAIIIDIKRHGSTSKITYFPAYFLHTVQEYIKHHDEELTREGKQARDAVTDARRVLDSLQIRDAQTIDALAAYNALTRSGPKPKPKKPKHTPPTGDQLSLL